MPHHRLEKENFKRLVLQNEPKLYEDLVKVFEVFQSTEEHLTLEEIASRLRENGIDIDEDTLKHYMSKIVDLGFAAKKEFQDQPVKYEHRHLGLHHDHILCVRCKKIVEFEDQELEQLQEAIAQRYGFQILNHRMELYGVCKDCRARMEKVLPLPMVRPGERCVVKEIMGGRMAKLRLFAMGIRPGDELEVISDSLGDGLIVARGDTRIAIGKGIAQKILVTMDKDGDLVVSSSDKGR
jgi:Fur family ferric uptake transcriptional regulator